MTAENSWYFHDEDTLSDNDAMKAAGLEQLLLDIITFITQSVSQKTYQV